MLPSDSQGSNLPFKKRLDNIYFLLKILHLFSLDLRVKYELTLQSILSVSSVQLLSHVRLFMTPWIAAHQASLSMTNSRSSLRLKSIESVIPSSHLSLCRPLLLLPPIPPSIRVFSSESALHMRWPKYWSFSFSIIPSKEIPGLISLEWTGWMFGPCLSPLVSSFSTQYILDSSFLLHLLWRDFIN